MDVDATPVPRNDDPEDTAPRDAFIFGDESGPAGREVLSPEGLRNTLTQLIRTWEGCENVSVLEVYRLDPVDRCDGCNWSLTLLLDPAGVPPEVYVLGYATALVTARGAYNLEEEKSGSDPESDPSW